MHREKFDPRNHENQDDRNRREYNQRKAVLNHESAEPPLVFGTNLSANFRVFEFPKLQSNKCRDAGKFAVDTVSPLDG
ncbi:MAG: hypothetical protein DMG23_05485 [Acidobacteria bacterium]|nr:MAG: hypothetical protein DMG23_05485 [Acidobacteriota bacterium]